MALGHWTAPVVVLLTAVAAGCGDESSEQSDGLSGEIAVAAASTSYPFAQAAADQFQIDNPGVAIRVVASRPADAFARLCNGAVALVTVPRQVEPRGEMCADGGVSVNRRELPAGAAGGAVHLYVRADVSEPPSGALADFIAAHHVRIAQAAADGRRAMTR